MAASGGDSRQLLNRAMSAHVTSSPFVGVRRNVTPSAGVARAGGLAGAHAKVRHIELCLQLDDRDDFTSTPSTPTTSIPTNTANMPGVSVRDVQADKFINAYAAFLKRQGKLPIPGS